MLVVAVASAIIIALIALSTAKINQAAFNGLTSSKIALQAQQYAAAEADFLQATDYDDLDNAAHGREQIYNSSDFESEIVLSDESDYSDEIKQRTGTIRIYRENENLPRYTLDTILLSEKQQASGVPIGTVITWPSAKNPEDGTWLECNGQSCAAYPQLVAVLGSNKVPDYRGRFLEGNTNPGTKKEAGLPNITGRLDTGGDTPLFYSKRITGAFSNGGSTNLNYGAQGSVVTHDRSFYVLFDASNSNPIYGSSETVQPPSVTVRYLIKAE